MKKQVSIIGGAGYTAGELLRLLIHHPHVNVCEVQSNSQAGKPLTDLHPDLIGETEQVFSSSISRGADLYVNCSGHGKSQKVLEEYPFLAESSYIDLSNDFRLDRTEGGFVYGLPELYREKIFRSKKVANPGCFATCIQLGLLPLAHEGLLHSDVHVHAITGSTGAGVGLSPSSHFSWRNSNVSIYKPFTHQHLSEIEMSLQHVQKDIPEIHFIPVRGNFTRGIFASMYTAFDGSQKQAEDMYREFYREEPFVFVSDTNPDLKWVVNTNKCVVYVSVHQGKLLVISCIDNLLKGASGQVVQNMNVMFDWEETIGLTLKGTRF